MKKLTEIKSLRKKLELLFLMSTLIFSSEGCTQDKDKIDTPITTEITTQEYVEENQAQDKNDTIEEIINKYKEKTNKNINSSNVFVDDFPQIKYLWKDKEDNYIYDYRINFDNNQELEYCDTNSSSKMYVVIVKNEDGTYEPIAGLVKNNDDIKNVTITYCYNNMPYEPSKNYIIIDNPTKEDLENLKKGNEYINSNYTSLNDKKLTLSKENN